MWKPGIPRVPTANSDDDGTSADEEEMEPTEPPKRDHHAPIEN